MRVLHFRLNDSGSLKIYKKMTISCLHHQSGLCRERAHIIKQVCGFYLPVVIHVAEFVGESLHVVWFEAAAVIHDVVVSRADAAQAHCLTHNEEIVPEKNQAISI